MSTWSQIQAEIAANPLGNGSFDFDKVRRGKLAALQAYTGRPVILYASDFTHPMKGGTPFVIISLDDKIAFKDVIDSMKGDEVDVILYLPGGSAEATESIVDILRSRFKSVRFVVPHVAKSAATMLAMSGDCILLDDHSELGPTDPQFRLQRGGDSVWAPAQAVIEQFDDAQKLLAKTPALMPAWIPVLQQYGPSLYQEAKNQSTLSVQLVSKWLRTFMFAGATTAKQKQAASAKATRIAKWLNSHRTHKSHGRRISMADLVKAGVTVVDMKTDPKLQTLVWDVQYALDHTFAGTPAVKIVEASNGHALIRMIQFGAAQPPAQQRPVLKQPPRPAPPTQKPKVP